MSKPKKAVKPVKSEPVSEPRYRTVDDIKAGLDAAKAVLHTMMSVPGGDPDLHAQHYVVAALEKELAEATA